MGGDCALLHAGAKRVLEQTGQTAAKPKHREGNEGEAPSLKNIAPARILVLFHLACRMFLFAKKKAEDKEMSFVRLRFISSVDQMKRT